MSIPEVGFKGRHLVGAKVDLTTDGLNISTKTVTVAAGSATGTAAVTAGSVILGIYPAGNQDQFVDSVAIASATLTITLAANATAINTFKVTVLEP